MKKKINETFETGGFFEFIVDDFETINDNNNDYVELELKLKNYEFPDTDLSVFTNKIKIRGF